jgi:hypothetical protein
MSEGQTDNSKPYDPMESFRGMRDAYLDAMAKTMVEAVNSDAYAQASGVMLDSTLTMSAPFREAMEKTMLQVLQQLSLPSRQDIIGLAERFINLEMRLDDMDASLDSLEGKVQKSLLPLLQQLLMLTETLGNLIKRVDSVEVKLDRLHSGSLSKSTPASKSIKTRSVAPATVRTKTTRGRSTASKQTQPKKRVVRKGAK